MADKRDAPDSASVAQSHVEDKTKLAPREEHLEKRFTLLSVIAFGFTTMNSWVAFASGVAVPLACGGGPGLIYGLIAAGVIMATINVGFAELASAFPSAGGQYHIVYMTFSPSTRRVAAFFTGWISIIYIMAATASCNFFVASSILDVVSLWNEGYEIQAWHTYLLHILLCIIAFVTTSRFPTAIGRLGVTILALSIVGFVASLVTLLAVKDTKQSTDFVFTDYRNVSGWPDGWAIFIGITGCLWAYSGVDAATHVSEEVPNPSRNVPIAIITTMVLGIVTVLVWNIALMFVVTDLQALIESGVPILEVYNQALNSKVATTIWAVYYMVMFYDIVLNLFIFAGRTIWSLSRDGGVPYSNYISHLNWASPVRATAVMLVLQVIIGVLYVASTTAYSSFINLTLFALNITVALPQAALLVRGRGILPERAFSLGKFGYAINAVATAFVIFFSVTFCFPTGYPVTAGSMNYLIVVMAVGLVVTTAAWAFKLRKTFTGPRLESYADETEY
ncbi:amino acid transporter [Pochonia chlamydosporia 170]|uniref:Amino acid transporter n=1 Tax=Pochonia chlamydosporia 170 TaxID=1380566 RepID=A0A179FGU8_METCM|nr:amino acid transporter [Pochonia chlamydosporia 170]OAQ64481.1 amino acid transporter [Pochonia chlamydosporia 170]